MVLTARFEKVAPGVELLKVPLGPIWTGVYLVTGERNYLIDSGSDSSDAEDIILPALREKGVSPGDVEYLLCTHCHGDHVGGHRALCDAGYRPACFSGSAEKLRDPLLYSKKIRAKFPEYSPQAPAGLTGCEPTHLIADGEALGGYLRLIHTPGHDDDTVCFLDERTGTLISGDSLQWNGTLTQGTALVMYLGAYLGSVEKLLSLKVNRVLPAHPYLPVGDIIEGEDNCRDALRQCAALMSGYREYIEESWAAGTRDAAELARGLITHIGGKVPDYLFLPLHTVAEHLNALGKPVQFGR